MPRCVAGGRGTAPRAVQTLRRGPSPLETLYCLHNSRWFCLSLLLMLIYRPEERELSPAFKLPDVSASFPRSCRVRCGLSGLRKCTTAHSLGLLGLDFSGCQLTDVDGFVRMRDVAGFVGV